jgi:hypothetical protein
MTLRAIARSRARTRAQNIVPLNRRSRTPKGRSRLADSFEDLGDGGIGDDDFVAVDCRPSGLWLR